MPARGHTGYVERIAALAVERDAFDAQCSTYKAQIGHLHERIAALEAQELEANLLRANLASAWFSGGWVAETRNEKEQQALMEAAGWWPWADEDQMITAVNIARNAALRRKE